MPSRSANAPSICPSMQLSAMPSRPTSVFSVAGSTRRERSPAAICAGGVAHAFERPQPEADEPPAERGERAEDDPPSRASSTNTSRRSVCVDVVERERDDERVPVGDPLGARRGTADRCRRASTVKRDRAAGCRGGRVVRPRRPANASCLAFECAVRSAGLRSSRRTGNTAARALASRASQRSRELLVDAVEQERAQLRRYVDERRRRASPIARERDQRQREARAQRQGQSSGGRRSV